MAALTAVLLALLALPARAAVPSNIGVASAVRGAVHATAPQAAGRVVETGLPVYAHDHVTTSADGKLQILLLDETTFTLGPNSDMVLDEFVYDPASGTGKVSASMAKGVFRFVTGKVARKDPASMRVTMPVGTIGIRGTMVAGQVKTDEATVVLIGPGRGNNADENPGGISVGNERGSTDIDTSGYGVTIRAGQAPSAPFELSPGQLQGILDGVSTAPTGEGGGGVDGSADKGSGQDSAQGKKNSQDALASLDAAMPDTSQFAAQVTNTPGFADGTSNWDDVRSIQTGTGQYIGSGTVNDGVGTFAADFKLLVDFGAKTLGGGGSNSIINASSTGDGAGSTQIYQFSYASLGGAAKVSMGGSLTYLQNYLSFPTATLTLVNKDGIAAKSATLDIVYGTMSAASGVITGTR